MNPSPTLFSALHSFFPVALLGISLSLTACFQNPDTAQAPPVETINAEISQATLIDYSPPTDAYGLPLNIFDVEVQRVRRGQTLSTLLSPFGIHHSTVHEISKAARGVYDLRRIQSGRDISFYRHPKTGALMHFVYHPNEREYVVFELHDGEDISVRTGAKAVETRLRRIESDIESSLYVSLMEAGANPALVNRLSQVYAWQIDFYRIMPNDRFTVVYEEELIDGKPVGIGKIQAALFHHRSEDYYAVYFEKEDGRGNYYDLEGSSLQKQFLRAPLEYSRISSRFTNRRYHPVLGRNMPHHGTDYAAATGTPIRAVGDGVIIHSAYDRNNGNYIRIRHNGTYETGYLHMSRRANGTHRGASVEQGQIIGYVGSTGLATGPHLCFRFWQNRQPVDPYRVEIPPSEPVEEEYKTQFYEVRDQKIQLLFPDEQPSEKTETITAQEAVSIGHDG